jgi:hypothetical protein
MAKVEVGPGALCRSMHLQLPEPARFLRTVVVAPETRITAEAEEVDWWLYMPVRENLP